MPILTDMQQCNRCSAIHQLRYPLTRIESVDYQSVVFSSDTFGFPTIGDKIYSKEHIPQQIYE